MNIVSIIIFLGGLELFFYLIYKVIKNRKKNDFKMFVAIIKKTLALISSLIKKNK
ncbi:conserved hypothetical protein [endosymbiont of Bathymodiolus septemdierum str. Myojin knoll]|uniref:Uncharacterized protein n=1 Tax=endosymbiont of Bathymodiolus septemdierum str. Myojin knoll TaxID=1303921 RepID=A0A0P0UTA9_9GAMM|nr:conserved hypothetical protein [endosymbiont of Bathymodiolus septemdierum str. Myojin knoll]